MEKNAREKSISKKSQELNNPVGETITKAVWFAMILQIIHF